MKKNIAFILIIFISIFQLYSLYILIGTGFISDLLMYSISFIICLYLCYYIYKEK